MKCGERVLHTDGGVGIIEEVTPWDDRRQFIYVRWQTPLDVPSCVCSTCSSEDLMVVPSTVKPEARSEKWMAESRAFCAAIEKALRQEGFHE